MSYGDRIKQIRKHFNLTQQDLANAIGAKNKQTISDVENGKQKYLNKKQELMLAEKFLISQLWLSNGEGEMLLIPEHACDVKEGGVIYGSTDIEHVLIPFYKDVYASAGAGSENHSMANRSPVTFSRDFLTNYLNIYNFKGLSIINAAGDSMDPTIRSGELMFVAPMENEEFKDGGIYVLMCSNVLLVKRVTFDPLTKEYTLVSDNGKVGPVTLSMDEANDCHFIGRVVGHLDRV